ncbi:MAG: acyl-ACP--UDP-N-acetylglucosamine O-acyltransferase [Candidatus Omnitrophica bacterium]|nr:acyl-ACP--UDP-N-acetylglucosamine O-acyltransferase [Candidatus Omnitrophota bacterium]
MKIHATAIVDKNAKLAEDVEVGPYAIIGPNVEIDAGTRIAAHCVIDGWTSIGKNCNIAPSAVIGGRPQDLKYTGKRSFVKIGNNNTIREFVTINRATGEDAATKIGSNNLIMAYAHIAHECALGNNLVIANAVELAGHITVEDGAILGGMAGVHQFVHIGKLAIIGGCTKVVKHIPPFALADGHPAKIYGLNIIGLNRAGISDESKAALKRAFKLLFNSGLSLPHALSEIEKNVRPSSEVKYLINFLKTVKSNTKRGVCR